MTMVKTDLVIIQPTPFCNINCRYCYLPSRSSTKKMSLETLAKIGERLFSSPFIGEEVTVVWHAGEPLVMPISFYEQAYEILQRYNSAGVPIRFSFQTNAVLVNEEWCHFFKCYNARVGVSLDGPKFVHDAHRVDRLGSGTFDRTLRGLKLLQASGIRPSVIMVVTADALDYPEEVWQFFTDNKIDLVGFNPEETEGFNTYSTLHNDRAIARYANFLRRVLRVAASTPSSPRLREFEATLRFIRASDSNLRMQDNTPIAILCFDSDGNISTFSPELLTARHEPYGDFVFGNVHHHSLEEVLQNEKLIRVNQAIQQGVEECRSSCGYFMFCGGGSPSNKIMETGTFSSTETRSCVLRVKTTTTVILEHLEEIYGLNAQEAGSLVGSDASAR